MGDRTLLLVDDDQNVLLTLSTILKGAGFVVTAASTPSEAIRHIAQQRFDILVTDLNIGQPGDGFTVVSALRRVQPDAAALIITGFPAFEAALQAIRNQVDDFLVKPVTPQAVLSTIERITQQHTHDLPVPLRSIAQIVREHQQKIVEEWADSVQLELEKCGHSSLSRDKIIDHMPALIGELCARVESKAEQTSPEARRASIAHGMLRKRQKLNPGFLLNEGTILREKILARIHQNMLSVDLSSLFVELAILSDSLDDQLKIALDAWLGEPDASW